jgi:hypothetical protein
MPPQITACLAPGEEILWRQQPRPYVFLLRGLPNIAYGVTWGVLGAVWYHGAGGISADTSAFEGWWRLEPLLTLPFILCGFSFFFYPIRLGARARRTWYVVTNRRIFIAQLRRNRPPELHVFTREEMGPPQVVKRFDGLYDLILSRSSQNKPYLAPRLESGFFGIPDGEAADQAIRTTMKAL